MATNERDRLFAALKDADARGRAGDERAARVAVELAGRLKAMNANDPIAIGAEENAAGPDAPKQEPGIDPMQAMGEGAVQGLKSLAIGGAQLATNYNAPARQIGRLGNAITGHDPYEEIRTGLNDYAANQANEYDATPAGQSGYGTAGRIGAEIAGTLPLAAVGLPVKGAGILKNLGRGIGGGMAMAAPMPVTEGDYDSEKLKQEAIAAGFGVLPLGISGLQHGIGSAASFGRRMISPSQGFVEREAGDLFNAFLENPNEALSSMRGNPNSYVPGTTLTSAEMTGDVGLMAAQNNRATKSNKLMDALAVRDQNTAIQTNNYIRQVFHGADDPSYLALKASRNARGNRDREAFQGVTGIDMQPVIDKTLDLFRASSKNKRVEDTLRQLVNGAFTEEIPAAKRLQLAQGVLDTIISNGAGSYPPAVLGILKKISTATDQAELEGLVTLMAGSGNAEASKAMEAFNRVLGEDSQPINDFLQVYNARKNLSGILESKAVDTAGETARLSAGQITEIKKLLDDQVDAVLPFKQYLRNFRSGSRKMEQNQAGQALLASANPITGSFGAESARLSGNPLELAKGVTSNTSVARNLFTDEQKTALGHINDDIRARETANAMSSSVMQLKKTSGLGGIGMLTPAGLLANRGMNFLVRRHGEKVLAVFDEMLLNPDKALEILARLPSQNRTTILREALPFFGIEVNAQMLRQIDDESRRQRKERNAPLVPLPDYQSAQP